MKVPIDWSGGVNLRDAPSTIGKDQIAYAKNLWPRVPGRLGKRGAARPLTGYYVDCNPMNGVHSAREIPWKPGSFVALTTRAPSPGGSVNLWGTDGVQYDWVVSNLYAQANPPAEVQLPIIQRARGCIHEIHGKLYVFGGTGARAVGYVLQRPDIDVPAEAATVDVATTAWGKCYEFMFTEASNADVRPHGACHYRARVAFWDFGPGYEDCIAFSDDDAPHTVGANLLAANGRYIRVPGRGRIVACQEVMLNATGSPAQAALLVLFEEDAFLITGEPDQTSGAGTNDLVVNKMNVNAGCASWHTIVQTPHGVIWAGREDVWLYQFGQTPTRVGSVIRPALEASSKFSSNWWFASFHDGAYRLALYSEGQTPKPGENDYVAAIACDDEWWLDLRGMGGEAFKPAWFGPQQYRTECDSEALTAGTQQGASFGLDYAFTLTVGGHPELVGVKFINNGTSSSSVLGLMVLDQASGWDSYKIDTSNRPACPATYETGVLGCEIQSELHSREYGPRSTVGGLSLTVGTDIPMRWQLDIVLDGGREVASSTKEMDAFSDDNTSFDQDAPGVNAPTYLKELERQGVDLYPPRTKRYTATRFQYRLKDVPGWVIPASADRFQIASANGAGPYTKASDQEFIQLTAGFYSSLYTLVQHIKTKLDAGMVLASNPVTIGTITSNDTLESSFKLTPNPVKNIWVDALPFGSEPTNDGTYTVAELKEHHRTLSRLGLNGNPSWKIAADYWETDDYDGATTFTTKSPVKQSARFELDQLDVTYEEIER